MLRKIRLGVILEKNSFELLHLNLSVYVMYIMMWSEVSVAMENIY